MAIDQHIEIQSLKERILELEGRKSIDKLYLPLKRNYTKLQAKNRELKVKLAEVPQVARNRELIEFKIQVKRYWGSTAYRNFLVYIGEAE